jgi:transcriptional regulator with XRE-family HTH domain
VRLKISQEELAGRAGMHATYLSDLERGQQTPTLDMLNRLSRGLGVTLAEFSFAFTQPYRARFRKPRRDAHRRRK